MSATDFEIAGFIRNRTVESSISCKSFVVTIFGDIVSQHGGWIWLGSLIVSLEPLGFSERLIRTSVFRLVKENWLQVKKVGRKSYYAFTNSANKHYTKAARRIYSGTSVHSDGNWFIVIPCFVEEPKLSDLKKQLRWLGFSSLSTGAYAHPSIDVHSLKETISELELSDAVMVFSSQTFDQASSLVLKKLVQDKWSIESLQANYQLLIDSYSVFAKLSKNKNAFNDQQSFLLRSLLIHEYRRVLLKDHELPENMLPENWSGLIANDLVKTLYSSLANSSCRYITSQLVSFDEYMPRATRGFKQRFNR